MWKMCHELSQSGYHQGFLNPRAKQGKKGKRRQGFLEKDEKEGEQVNMCCEEV